MASVKSIKNNGKSSAGTPSYQVTCSTGKTVIIYKNQNNEWTSGSLGAMGAKYNNYSTEQMAEYICNRWVSWKYRIENSRKNEVQIKFYGVKNLYFTIFWGYF